MNYIVLDLEWNQCASGKEFENSEMPFEIIEIGAVKLNEDMQEIDSFKQIIKPQVYTKIHEKTKDIINISKKELNDGKGFEEVVTSFFEWCGKDYIFCTWGAMDLTELQRNIRYFKVKLELSYPIKYCNVQKMFSFQYENSKEVKTLEYAVESLNIEKGQQFHSALSDAFYTGRVLAKIDKNIVESYFSIDYYNCPVDKESELYIVNGERVKYVSRGFESKEEAMADKTVTRIYCNVCKKALKKKIKWFSSNSKIYYGVGKCENHGYVRGKIRIKKNSEGKYFVIRTTKIVSEEKVKEIEQHKVEIKKRRRNKRLEKMKK